MSIINLEQGLVHEVPHDLLEVLTSDDAVLEKWNKLTPLARNEWICWTISVKQDKTRKEHILRLQTDILEGKKRPCCWPGCSHRHKAVNNLKS